jgi:hypothetical protein
MIAIAIAACTTIQIVDSARGFLQPTIQIVVAERWMMRSVWICMAGVLLGAAA